MKKKILIALCATATMASADVVLDDFDDAVMTNAEGLGAEAYWYLYTAGGSVTNVNNGKAGWDMFGTEGENGYAYMTGISGITKGSDQLDPPVYASVGLGLDFPTGVGLSGCTSFTYKYKGAAHRFRALVTGVTPDEGKEHVSADQETSSDWKTATITTMSQPSWVSPKVTFAWNKVTKIAWVVDEKNVDASASTLMIDDVTCVGGTVTSSTTPSSSSTTTTAVLIDDFDDANTTSENLGKTAYWYIYTAGGSVGNTQDATTQSWDLVVTEGTNSYLAMQGITGITSGATTYPSVGMEVEFTLGTLSGCSAVQYDYKGSGHIMRASVNGVKPDKGYEHVAAAQPATTTWKTVTVSTMTQPDWVSNPVDEGGDPSSVVPFSWAKVSKMAWVVNEKLTAANIGTELDIDNVKCVGTLSTTTTASSASAAITAVAAPVGLSATLQGKTLQVSVAKAGLVKVQVFDMMGHAIESHSENMAAGSFAHSFEALPMGSYVVRVQQGSMMKTLRMQIR